jgi:hypothetical protein
MIAFISPINDFLDMAQQSDSLNCKGYIYGGNVNHTLSFNSTLNGGASGSPIACIALKLYLPYILLIFLIGGVAMILGGKGDVFGFGDSQQQAY